MLNMREMSRRQVCLAAAEELPTTGLTVFLWPAEELPTTGLTVLLWPTEGRPAAGLTVLLYATDPALLPALLLAQVQPHHQLVRHLLWLHTAELL